MGEKERQGCHPHVGLKESGQPGTHGERQLGGTHWQREWAKIGKSQWERERVGTQESERRHWRNPV